VRRAVLGTASGLCQLALMAFFAPALAACLAFAPPRRGMGQRDAHARQAGCCTLAMPPVIGAWAWFLAWRLHMPPPSHGGQPAAITVGILFAAQALVLGYVLALGAAFGGERLDLKEPDRPLVFFINGFRDQAFVLILLSLPLAVVVAVIGSLLA